MFDGEIYVYNASIKDNSSYVGRIHVQVKGEKANDYKPEESKFYIEEHALDAYLKEGGIAFFHVLISEDGESEKVFFANLLPFKINQIIKAIDREKKRKGCPRGVIRCLPFPTSTNDITDWALNFLQDCQKQSVRQLISLEDLAKSNQIKNFSFDFTSVNGEMRALERIFREDFYIYAQTYIGDIKIPVELLEGGERTISTEFNEKVSVGDRVFFDKFKVDFTEDTETIHIGKSISLVEPRNGKKGDIGKFIFKLAGTLAEMILDSEFIIELSRAEKFMIGDKERTVTLGIDVPSLENELSKLQRYKVTLDAAGVTYGLDVQSISDDDKLWIALLYKSLVQGQGISITPSAQMEIGDMCISLIKVANLSTCLLIQKISANKFMLYNPFRNNLDFRISVKDYDGQMHNITKFYFFKEKHFIDMSNLDIDVLLDDIIAIGQNPANIQCAYDLMFCAIHAFDKTNSKRDELLELAKRITYWGMEQDYDDKYVVDSYNELNLFQILKREGNLSQANKKRIEEMIVDFTNDNLLLTGAYILLENYDLALEKYSLLCDDDKEHLKQLPIMNLWSNNPYD